MDIVNCEVCGIELQRIRRTRRICRACSARASYERKKGKQRRPVLKDLDAVEKRCKNAAAALRRLRVLTLTDEPLIYALDALFFFADSLGFKYNAKKDVWEAQRT